ncbi:sensor histidine kinase [Nocardia gamkensis]|uniref:histidine kinase n=1 Tax=Nocardia gamkensis TaxID=352869 RepID=A0A7X6L3R1_9NOCA|nr:HAMP domain-containing sensor histidine kinase [Nocardia gamkensis]NKY27094.1 HAMP domain-containing histidine kinase [Nocardia gamkensis]NQE70944.1 Sensor-type histidine kinase PrrB [Nocardia gamkensis]
MSGSPSLRTRVAVVSGVVAALVTLTLTITFATLLGATGERQLDQTVSSMAVRIAAPLEAAPAPPSAATLSPEQAPADARRPGVPADAAITRVDGLPGVLVALDPDRDVVEAAIHRSQRIGLGIGVAGALLAALLGWFLAGFAARPLRRLADATHRIDTLEELPPLSGRGAREAEELSDAITRMLARLEAAHRATQRALTGARDFAAVCAHELRTPLTALRTDLQVLATMEIPDQQRGAIMSEVLLAEQHIENTLTDLERLAVGELTGPDVFEPFDLCDVLDRAVHDARRRHPGVRVELTECAPVTVTGSPGGVGLIVTNAVANAVQHGRAETVTVSVRSGPEDIVEIRVDDDGRGIPEALRADAFDRFVKGPGSPGSGLGLALVRQQAELHSGTAELGESPLGGARLRVRLRAAG